MTQCAKDTGIVKSAGMHKNEMGQHVLRVVVDFFDGDAPAWNFEVIFKQSPVRIVLADGEAMPSKEE